MQQRPRWLPWIIAAWVVLLPALAISGDLRVGSLLELQVVTDQLDDPTAAVGDPSSTSRLFVTERAGRLVVVEDGTFREDPLLDLTAEVSADELEQGLLGIALHPDFAANGRLFLYLTDRASRMVVLEYRMAADGAVVDPTTRREILAIRDPDPFHNGGQLAFGPDGRLYVGVGDGGLLENGFRDGRDPASLLGKILRLDVDAPPDDGLAYAIPPDNPYLGVAGARPEVWAVGLRNPWRFAFDKATGTLWVADVGQRKWEEINALPWNDGAGANFGWNLTEGRVCFGADTCDRSGLVMPFAVYSHAQGNCAVIGGFVYHGPGGRLDGQYLVGDYCSGRIWTIGPGKAEMVLQQDTDLEITSFGEGADGSAYVMGRAGELVRLVPRPLGR
jgi:glucose/arabinose dehydrogenase